MIGFFPGCGRPLDPASYKNNTAIGFQCLFWGRRRRAETWGILHISEFKLQFLNRTGQFWISSMLFHLPNLLKICWIFDFWNFSHQCLHRLLWILHKERNIFVKKVILVSNSLGPPNPRGLAQATQCFFPKVLYVLIAISAHNSAQNVIMVNSDHANKLTFRRSD